MEETGEMRETNNFYSVSHHPLNHQRDFILSFSIVKCSDVKGRCCIIHKQEGTVTYGLLSSFIAVSHFICAFWFSV